MRKFLALLFLLPLSAQAADIPVRPLAPAPIVTWSWSGFYVGADIGYGWGNVDHNVLVSPETVAISTDNNGVIGGLYAGYNWQFGGWVLGIETDISASGIKGTTDIGGKIGTVPYVTQVESKVTWLGTTRARAGWLATNSILLYGTGGIAYGNVEDTVRQCLGCSSLSSSFATAATVSDVKIGWTAGAGAEWAATQNVLLRIEYLFYSLGDTSSLLNNSSKHDGSIVRAGAALKF